MSATPAQVRKSLTIAAAAAVAGSVLIMPSAGTAAAAVTYPEKLTVTDTVEYKNDAITLPEIDGVQWKVKVGTAAEAVATGGYKPWGATDAAAPGASTTVVVSAYESGTTAAKTYKVTLTNKKAVVVKPAGPKVTRDKKTGLDTVTVPYVKGVKWTYAEGNGAAAAVDFGGLTKAKVITPSAETSEMTFVANPADASYTMTDGKSAIVSTWTVPVRGKNVEVVVAENEQLKAVDNPGKGDYVTVTGTEGVEWLVGTKTVKVAPGKTAKIARAKDATSVVVEAKAATGYALKSALTSTFNFTDLTDVTVNSPLTGLTAKITATTGVKDWTFTPTGARAIKLAAPKVGSVVYNLPAAGQLKAVPATGYSVNANGDKGAWDATAPAAG